MGESNGVQNMWPSIWDESNWVQRIGPLLKGNLIGIHTIEPSFGESLKYWALICEESNGASPTSNYWALIWGESTIGFKLLGPHLGECNGSPSYWAPIWESVMGVQTIGPSFGGKTKEGVSKAQTIGPSN